MSAELPLIFERTMRAPSLVLHEELKVETADDGSDQFYYRSRWPWQEWTAWGFWQKFPKDTKTANIMTFLNNAGWELRRA